MTYVGGDSNGRPSALDALGELGGYFLARFSGLGDYYAALRIAGPVIADRLRHNQLGAVAAPTLRGGSAMAILYRKMQAQRAAQQAAQQAAAPPLPPPPSVNVVSLPNGTAVPAPTIPTPIIQQKPTVDWGYDTSYFKSGAASPEVGTLPDGKSTSLLAGFSPTSPLLLVIAAAAFFMLDGSGKPKRRRR